MTTTSTPSTKTLAVAEVVFTDAERVALAGSLAGYRGLTRDAYALDLRLFVSWCEQHGLKLFSVRRSDIELYARHLEETGRAQATVARRPCTVAGFYRYAEKEGLVPTSPAVHVRRPRLDCESHTIGLDRNEVGALLVAAGLGAPSEHALSRTSETPRTSSRSAPPPVSTPATSSTPSRPEAARASRFSSSLARYRLR